MKNYREPVEDGLLMRTSGPWAAEKLDYLKRYIEIFETSMHKKWARRNFVDLFSGPGKCRTDSGKIFLGSPLLALTTAHPFTDYFFADIDRPSISKNTGSIMNMASGKEADSYGSGVKHRVD